MSLPHHFRISALSLLICCSSFLIHSIRSITLTQSAFVEPSDHSKSFSGKFVIYDDFDRQMVESSVEPTHSIGPVAFALAPPMSTATNKKAPIAASDLSTSTSSASSKSLIKKQATSFDSAVEQDSPAVSTSEILRPSDTHHHHHHHHSHYFHHASDSTEPEVKASPSDNSHIVWNDDKSLTDDSRPVSAQVVKQLQQDHLSKLLINLPPPTRSAFVPTTASSSTSSTANRSRAGRGRSAASSSSSASTSSASSASHSLSGKRLTHFWLDLFIFSFFLRKLILTLFRREVKPDPLVCTIKISRI